MLQLFSHTFVPRECDVKIEIFDRNW